MAFSSWRGVVGMINPTMRPGVTEEVCRLLPEGIGLIPLFLNIKRGTEDEFHAMMPHYEKLVAVLAEQECDLIHPHGAPPFMVLGRSDAGVDFDALDGKPTHLFFLLGLRYQALHLPWLAKLTQMLAQPGAVKRVLAAEGPKAIFAALTESERRLASHA